jgi:xanthosine utilization system XapX-like protein
VRYELVKAIIKDILKIWLTYFIVMVIILIVNKNSNSWIPAIIFILGILGIYIPVQMTIEAMRYRRKCPQCGSMNTEGGNNALGFNFNWFCNNCKNCWG